MNARRPSKKRNALLMFEFLTKEASRCVVAGDNARSEKIITVLKEAYAHGTELHREYRLARSLLVTKVSSPAVAAHILAEARSAVRSLDNVKLNSEKSSLIARVEKEVDSSGSLYEASLNDYRLRSTVGTLFSDWRDQNDDLTRMAQYEDQLMEHLTSKVEDETTDNDADKMSIGERRAVIAIMSRKLEERWGKTFNKEQRFLLRDYILAKDPSSLLERLRDVRLEAIKCLEGCASAGEVTEYFGQRLNESLSAISAKPIDTVDDDSVSLSLLYLKLLAESTDGDNL